MGAVLFALMAPDLDAAAGFVTGQGVGRFHNGLTHSLLCAPVFGCVFALIGRPIARCKGRLLFRLGSVAYLSHIVLDLFNARGRGVQLFWPLSETRFASPVPLFYGVIHSVDAPWSVHLVTIVNELLFAAAVWIACVWRRRRGSPMPKRPPSVPPW